MLVLTRRVGETLVIDGRIRITVTRIQHGQVKLGVVADGMIIDREEIHEQRTRKNPPSPGTCRICGCTEERACQLGGDAFVVPCEWVNIEKTLCSNPTCLEAANNGQ